MDGYSAEKLTTRLKFEEHEGMFTGSMTAMVWSSRRTGSECLV